MKHNHSSIAYYQRGVASLITSLILLVAMTLVTIFAARSAIMEQKIFANEYRANQAFEAAEAGLEYGIAYALTKGWVDKDDNGIDTFTTKTLPNTTDYTVTFTYTPPTDTTKVLVTSIGRSDDDSAVRTVSQMVVRAPPFPSAPSNPLITKGTVDINGAGDIINPEGNATIWTGSPTVDFSGSSGKTKIPDPSNPANLIDSSDSSGLGPDVITDDTNLSSLTDDEYFENFLGSGKSDYKSYTAERIVSGSNVNNAYNHATQPGVSGATQETIWVDGNASFSGNTTVGCTVSVTGSNTCTGNGGTEKPVVMVIDGDLLGSGTTIIYGLVYITGNYNSSGGLSVVGSVMVEGNVTGTGSIDVTYDSAVLGKLYDQLGVSAALAGSWKDFN